MRYIITYQGSIVRAFTMLVTLIISLNTFTSTSWCAESTFVKLEYGGYLSLEVPRHWTFVDENTKKSMNNFSEAVAKLNGINLNQGNNNILISANAYKSSSNYPSASLRLSVRSAKSLTQDEMKELSRYPASELQDIFNNIAVDLKRAMLSIDTVKSYSILESKIISNSNVLCFYVKSQTELNDGTTSQQTYICPIGNKSVKLAVSYRNTDKAQFKPVLDYVWKTLTIK